jgi:large subunit ribosomal protein L3
MKFILGKKIEMTQVWKNDEVVAATRIQAGPCTVVQVKNEKKDGYVAAQIGFGTKKEKNIKKPQLGHLKKLGNFRYLREFEIENADSLKAGDKIDVGTFNTGDKIIVIGISKGKGFQGVVKRHHFHGHNKTHGTKDAVRMPGSIGAGGVAHVFKGMRMPGRMGGDRVTVTNLEIVDIDQENNILLIKGAVPGARNSLVLISGEGELKLSQPATKEEKAEETSIKSEKNIEPVQEEKRDENIEIVVEDAKKAVDEKMEETNKQ